MNRLVLLASFALLAGCNGQSASDATITTTYAAANALAAADTLATQYVRLPLCGPTHAAPLCSDANITTQIKAKAQAAHDAVKAAEAAGGNANTAAVSAAISLMTSLIPAATAQAIANQP